MNALSIVFVIAMYVAIDGAPSIRGNASTGVVLASLVPWAVVVLGLGVLTLLATGWRP